MKSVPHTKCFSSSSTEFCIAIYLFWPGWLLMTVIFITKPEGWIMDTEKGKCKLGPEFFIFTDLPLTCQNDCQHLKQQACFSSAHQWSSFYGSWGPRWTQLAVRPALSPSSGSHWGHSGLKWKGSFPNSLGAPPAWTCPHCKRSESSPLSVWIDQWMSR